MDDRVTEPETVVSLYHRAFAQYRTRALWNVRHIENPTIGEALAITKALRTYGGMDGRRMAEQLEKYCLTTLDGTDFAAH